MAAGFPVSPKRPTTSEENSAWHAGHTLVAGVDEVGRGPLAGPVVAAAVVLPHPLPQVLRTAGIRDSKQLSARARARLAPLIRRHAVGVGVGEASVEEVDALNVLEATRLAMARAVAELAPVPDLLLVDALDLPQAGIPCRPIVHGDALCLSIAAASIVAKVFRDALMVEMDGRHPGYGFARHKGYGTAEHLAALRRLGPTPEHRRTFGPVRAMYETVHA
jgi:ribonuclease HII